VGGAGGRPELPELDGDRRAAALGVLPARRHVGEHRNGPGPVLAGSGDGGEDVLDPPFGGGDPVGGLVDGGLHLEQRRRRRRATAQQAGADHVALEGDRGERGLRRHELGSRVEVGDDGDAVQQAVEGRGEARRRLHEGPCPPGARRGRRPGGVGEQRPGRRARDQDARLARVVGLQQPQRGDGGRRGLDGHRVGSHAQRGRDGVLVARLDGEQSGQRTEQT
jgi:hypothetical protein